MVFEAVRLEQSPKTRHGPIRLTNTDADVVVEPLIKTAHVIYQGSLVAGQHHLLEIGYGEIPGCVGRGALDKMKLHDSVGGEGGEIIPARQEEERLK